MNESEKVWKQDRDENTSKLSYDGNRTKKKIQEDCPTSVTWIISTMKFVVQQR